MPSLTNCVYSVTWPAMNTEPMRKVMMNHMRSFRTSPRSAANTPSWQVTEESTSTMVLTVAKGMFSFSVKLPQDAIFTERSVKYIANRAAKNMSSLASHTIVPTDTMLGLLAGACTGAFSITDAVATRRLWQVRSGMACPPPESAWRRGEGHSPGRDPDSAMVRESRRVGKVTMRP
ncbi:unannotated protein [freshwater metagenome]|uniref:Unannotated protein n=1 Tax=freshwater metagenome TaxID=449393 RepID=A0A6J7SIF3_9ZZZZ